MKVYFFRKLDDTYTEGFREIALRHNVVTSKVLAAIIGAVCLVLCVIDRSTTSGNVLKYPAEYSAAILFIFFSSLACYTAFLICKRLGISTRLKAYKFLANFYPVIVIISSLWITFVMQHNPSNTMSIFVLGLLMVASLWIFGEVQAIVMALLILVLFDGGLHYFQTDDCKLFANYITGTCVSIFFVCISRISFSVNYNNFIQLKKIEDSRRSIEKINEMQTEILSVVAHDLHAPIHSIMALTELMKDAETPEEAQEYYDLIMDTCNRSNTIIDDLLSEARNLEADNAFTYTCVNDLIEDAVSQFSKSKAGNRQIIFRPPHEKMYANLNEHKMLRVLDNLLNNAIKFTRNNGVVTITISHEDNKINIFVADNGIGIPEALLPFLFNRFSKAGRTGVNGEKSYGLGLSICKLIVNQHSGDISATSKEEHGTEIKITLPAANE